MTYSPSSPLTLPTVAELAERQAQLNQALTQHPLLQAVAMAVKAHHGHAYWVGGCLRDPLLALPYSPDWDALLLNANAEAVATTVAETLAQQGYDVRLVTLDAVWGIYRVVVLPPHPPLNEPLAPLFEPLAESPIYLDIAQALNNRLEDDLLRRDLTLNALAYAMHADDDTHAWVDAVGGIEHLRQGVLAGVQAVNFTDDPLRVLRVARFTATLPPFAPNPETLEWMQPAVALLPNVAPERCQAELLKLVQGAAVLAGVRVLQACGALPVLFPALAMEADQHTALDRLQRLETLATVVAWVRPLKPLLALACLHGVETSVHSKKQSVIASEAWQSPSPLLGLEIATMTDSPKALEAHLHQAAYPNSVIKPLITLASLNTGAVLPPLASLPWLLQGTASSTDQEAWVRFALANRTRGGDKKGDAKTSDASVLSSYQPVLVWVAWQALLALLESNEALPPPHLDILHALPQWLESLPTQPLLRGSDVLACISKPAGAWVAACLQELWVQQALGKVRTVAEAQQHVCDWVLDTEAQQP